MSRRSFWLAAAALLAIMAAAEISSARQEVQTADEAVHLVSGYSILRQGRFSLNAENPPVSKTLEALPLLLLDPDLPRDSASDWQGENSVAISAPFLYRNRLPAGEILLWGRAPTMLLTLVFGAAFAWWMRFRFGAAAALFALALYCFDPNFIAHGRYVTSDVWGACFFFAGCVAWGESLLRQATRWAVAASLLTSVGICCKFNLLLLPVVVVVMTLAYRSKLPRFPVRAIALYLALIPPAIWAIYGFELRTIASDEPAARFLRLNSAQLAASPVLPRPAVALLDPAGRTGAAIHWAAGHVPIPAYSFFKGLYRLYNHDYWGHRAYLAGRVSDHGWWWYFPLAFLVKTPTGTLLLILFAAFLARGTWRRGKYPLAFFLAPAALYFVVAMAGRIDIGVRHILPIYPFLFGIVGAVVAAVASEQRFEATGLRAHAGSPGMLVSPVSAAGARREPGKPAGRHLYRNARMGFAGLFLAFVIAESVSVYPNYLAFFNLPSGGPSHGAAYLVDSNLDWGQDVLKLKDYMQAHRLAGVPLHYFGSADLGYYGLSYAPLENALGDSRRRVVAISATALEMDAPFARLRRCRPIDRIGYSIYVYDLNSPSCPPAAP